MYAVYSLVACPAEQTLVVVDGHANVAGNLLKAADGLHQNRNQDCEAKLHESVSSSDEVSECVPFNSAPPDTI